MIRRLGRQCGTLAEPLATPRPVVTVFILIYIFIVITRAVGFDAFYTVVALASVTTMIGVALRQDQ